MTIDKKLEWKVKTINEDILRCNKCKKMRTSKIDDVSTKNPNYYYKFCENCRLYFRDYVKRNNIDYRKYQPGMS